MNDSDHVAFAVLEPRGPCRPCRCDAVMRLQAREVVVLEYHTTRLQLFDLRFYVVRGEANLGVPTAGGVWSRIKNESRPACELVEDSSR